MYDLYGYEIISPRVFKESVYAYFLYTRKSSSRTGTTFFFHVIGNTSHWPGKSEGAVLRTSESPSLIVKIRTFLQIWILKSGHP